MKTNPLPTLFLTFHVESDAFYTDHDNFDSFKGFESGVQLIKGLEQSSGQPVQVLWQFRCDPQMGYYFGDTSYLFKKYQEEIDTLQQKGDELGIHVHPFRKDGKEEVQDFEDKSWMNECVEVSVKTFKNNMGYTPRSISIGHGATYTEVVNFCRSQGIRYDFSLEYPISEEFPVNVGNFRGKRESGAEAPRAYYCPTKENMFEVSSDQDYFLIPISRTAMAYRIGPLKKMKRLLKGKPLKRLIKLSLALHPEEFRALIKKEINERKILTIDTRSHVFADPEKYGYAQKNLQYLISLDKKALVIETPDRYFQNKLESVQ